MGGVEYLQNSRFLAKSAWKFALSLAKKNFFAISLQNGHKLMLKTAIKLENLAKLDGGCRIPSKFEIFG